MSDIQPVKGLFTSGEPHHGEDISRQGMNIKTWGCNVLSQQVGPTEKAAQCRSGEPWPFLEGWFSQSFTGNHPVLTGAS